MQRIGHFCNVGLYRDVYDPNGNGDEETPNSFPFSTTTTIQLNVKYDVPKGYKVLFNVYLENPFMTNDEGQVVLRTDLAPVVIRMTDENGVYNGKETITADHGSDAYIYTSYVGVPGLFKTSLSDNAIHADIKWELTGDTPHTRAGEMDCSRGIWSFGRLGRQWASQLLGY